MKMILKSILSLQIFATSVFAQNYTFTKHIAPLVFSKCAPCHNSEGIAPFGLTNFEEIKKKGKMIKLVTGIKYMPPFFADPHYSLLADVQSLTSQEIKMIANWVDNNMPYGDKNSAIPSYQKKDIKAKPDLVLTGAKIPIAGDNTERFYHIKIPFRLPVERNVCHCELVPGNTKVVHHVNAFIYNFSEFSPISEPPFFVDGDKFKQTGDVLAYLKLYNTDGSKPQTLTASVLDYFPGMLPVTYPKGMQKVFEMGKNGAFYLNIVHYGPSPIPTSDQIKINIFFCKEPFKRKVYGHAFGSPTHIIEPNLLIPKNKIKTFKTRLEIKTDISILSVQPHAHLLCEKIKVYIKTAKNTIIPVLKIDKWDFRWQRVYKLKHPIKAPAGSNIILEGTYNNTVENSNNPYNPPQDIPESIKTKDEMLQLWFDFVAYQSGDEKIDLEQK